MIILLVKLNTAVYNVETEVNVQRTTTSLGSRQFWQTTLCNFTVESFDMIKLYHNNVSVNNNSTVPRCWSIKGY